MSNPPPGVALGRDERPSRWKDGQGDARKYQRIMSLVGDRLAWIGGIGDDCVPAYFAIGVQAFTSSISPVAPRLSLALAEAGFGPGRGWPSRCVLAQSSDPAAFFHRPRHGGILFRKVLIL